MLEQAFAQLGERFPARFVLGQFLPVFTMACVNLLLFSLYVYGWSDSFEFVTGKLALTDFATAIGIVASSSAAVAFTLGPLLSVLRRILEGSLLPEGLRARLIASNRRWADRRRREIMAINDLLTTLDLARREIGARSPTKRTAPKEPVLSAKPNGRAMSWLDRLVERLVRTGKPSAPAPVPAIAPAAQEVAHVAALVDAMAGAMTIAETAASRTTWRTQTGIDAAAALKAAGDALVALADKITVEWPDDLAQARGRFLEVTNWQIGVFARLASDRTTALNLQFVAGDPRATRFGNLRAALENYTFKVYGVGFDYLWPRVQMVIEKDDANAAVLGDARTQLDYTLVAMLLALLTCAFWLVTLVWSDDQVGRFLVVGVASWLVFHLFYRIALEAQRALTEITKAIVDKYRFDLFTALASPLPADNDAERAQWRKLADVAAGGRPNPPLGFKTKTPE